MDQIKKIPLWIAILININIVVGGGFFLSASNVLQVSGLLAPLTWIFCGLLLLPLIYIFATLANLYPTAGGLYIYSKNHLGPWWGFISGWSYFVGTAAGNACILHAFSSLIKKMGFVLPWTNFFSEPVTQLLIDIFLIIIFTTINMFNITVLEKMNVGFTILKTIPIALVIGASFFLFSWDNLTSAPVLLGGIVPSIPIVLFAYLGIEACCSIAHTINDGKKNVARAMFISFSIIMALYAVVQTGLLGILGITSKNPFFEIIPLLSTNSTVIGWGNFAIKLAILSSYLGGFYSMYYANAWNLYAIAKEKKTSFFQSFTHLNKHQTPWISILAQGTMIILLLLTTLYSTDTLMIMSGFGVVIAYILSTLTYLTIAKKQNSGFVIGILGLVGSLALLTLCFNDLFAAGLKYLLPFLGILGAGLMLY